MIKVKDFFEREIEIGDSVITQDKDRVTIGKASHYSPSGNLIIYGYTHNKLRLNSSTMWKRIMKPYYSTEKVVITTDPTHLQFTANIKIKGE